MKIKELSAKGQSVLKKIAEKNGLSMEEMKRVLERSACGRMVTRHQYDLRV